MSTANPHKIRSSNWDGSIPVVATLASASLSSPTPPAPLHVLLSRQTYLHVGLRSVVERFHPYAPTSISFASGWIRNEPSPGGSNDDADGGDPDKDGGGERQGGGYYSTQTKTRGSHNRTGSATNAITEGGSHSYPVCWFEDEATSIALRWHVFVGVLFDGKRDRQIPWRIKVHFTGYPYSQILPLQRPVLQQVQFYFKHSFKQALCLQYGNSKTAMNVTKESHEWIWESILGGTTAGGGCGTAAGAAAGANYQLYRQAVDGLQPTDASKLCTLPVRLYFNARPPVQRKCGATKAIPRDGGGGGGGEGPLLTLGELLAEWLPDYFVKDERVPRPTLSADGTLVAPPPPPPPPAAAATTTLTNQSVVHVKASGRVVAYRVAGISPPLETPLMDLWTDLCHPDYFLYITVIAN